MNQLESKGKSNIAVKDRQSFCTLLVEWRQFVRNSRRTIADRPVFLVLLVLCRFASPFVLSVRGFIRSTVQMCSLCSTSWGYTILIQVFLITCGFSFTVTAAGRQQLFCRLLQSQPCCRQQDFTAMLGMQRLTPSVCSMCWLSSEGCRLTSGSLICHAYIRLLGSGHRWKTRILQPACRLLAASGRVQAGSCCVCLTCHQTEPATKVRLGPEGACR